MKILDELIPLYHDVKTNADKYKKEQDEINTKIKSIMRDLDEGTYECGDLVAQYSVVNRDGFDMGKLLKLFDSDEFKQINEEYKIIKLQPYIDMSAIENAIYDGRLDATKLTPYKTSNPYEKLVVKVKKKGKNDAD